MADLFTDMPPVILIVSSALPKLKQVVSHFSVLSAKPSTTSTSIHSPASLVLPCA